MDHEQRATIERQARALNNLRTSVFEYLVLVGEIGQDTAHQIVSDEQGPYDTICKQLDQVIERHHLQLTSYGREGTE
jgi:hypothetical protein